MYHSEIKPDAATLKLVDLLGLLTLPCNTDKAVDRVSNLFHIFHNSTALTDRRISGAWCVFSPSTLSNHARCICSVNDKITM